jgi:hypothetical protein
LIKNNANGYGPLFYVGSGTMYVKECTIQSGYTYAKSGNFYTSYSNTVAGSECAAITTGVTKNDDKCRCLCSDWDIVLLHKIHIIWTILKYIKLVCYNNIFIKYTITMCNICILYRIYCTITQDIYNNIMCNI